MIGLSPNAARLYAEIVALCAYRGVAICEREVYEKSSLYGNDLTGRLRQLVKRKFVKFDRTGRFIALEPPHQTVMRETCMRIGVSEADVLSKSHISEFVRARRIIAKRLRDEFNYPLCQIALALKRHDTTVADYFGRERAQKRSRARAIALYGEGIAA